MALVCVRRFRLLVALSVQTNTAMGPLQIFALLQQPHLYVKCTENEKNMKKKLFKIIDFL